MATSSLRDLARACWRLVEALCARLESNNGLLDVKRSLRESRGRLNIWIGSYDSFQDDDNAASVDDTLRSAPRIAQQISKVLDILHGELENVQRILDGVSADPGTNPHQNPQAQLHEGLLATDNCISELFEQCATARLVLAKDVELQHTETIDVREKPSEKQEIQSLADASQQQSISPHSTEVQYVPMSGWPTDRPKSRPKDARSRTTHQDISSGRLRRATISVVGSHQNGFKVLRTASDPKESRVMVILVTVPWLMPGKDWLGPETGPKEKAMGNATVYEFNEWKIVDEDFTWPMLRAYGSRLADQLLDLYNEVTDGVHHQIVFMAHSLSGIILKHCLSLIHHQRDRYRFLKDATAGVIFLGTPHASTTASRQALYERAKDILHMGTPRISRKLDSDDDLLSICLKFNEVQNSVPILSIHETLETKTKSRGFRTSSTIIVEKRLARIDSLQETLTAVRTDHRSLPSLGDPDSPHHFDEEAMAQVQDHIKKANDKANDKALAQALKDNLSFKKRRSSFGSASKCTTLVENDNVPLLENLVENFETPRPFPTLPCRSLGISRQQNADFHGREQTLSRLKSQLLAEPGVAIVLGIGGVGKSDVALEFVYQNIEDFDAVFWIQSDNVSKMRQSFGRIAMQLGLEEEKEANDPHTSREIAKAWLIDPKKKSNDARKGESNARWLLVFDGVDDAGSLEEFKPIFGNGAILITTRNQALASNLPQTDTLSIQLDFFSVDEAASLLKKFTAKPGIATDLEDDAAEEIVQQYGCGGWPIAIIQTARTIRNKYDITLAEFRDMYQEQKDLGRIQAQDECHRTLAAAMNIAELSSQATALLQVCSMLDPDRIQESLLSAPFETTSLRWFPSDPMQLAAAKAELLRSSVVHRNSARDELWMHRIVQETVRRQCSPADFNNAFSDAAKLVSNSWKPPGPYLRDYLKLWTPCAEFLQHIIHLKDIFIESSEESTTQAISPSLSFAWLLCQAATIQTNLGNTAGQKEILVLATKVCNLLPKETTFGLLSDIYHELGAWASETNQADESFHYSKLYLDMRLEAVDEGQDLDERTASAWNQFGTALMGVKRYAEAMDAFQKSIDMYATLEDTTTKCPDSLPVVNLANARWLTGDHEGASRLLDEGLLDREEAFGLGDTESFRTGRFYHMLGNVRYAQGRPAESKIWHKRALKQYVETLGKTHHRTADVGHRVAQHCVREKDYRQALNIIDQALNSWKLDPESFQQEIARTTWLKAQQRGKAGNPVEKRLLMEEAVAMYNTLRPGEQRTVNELSDEDFDDLVAFWSR